MSTDTGRLVVCTSHSPGMERDERAAEGLGFRAGLAEARGLVKAFRPDRALVFGGDHRRAFVDVVPAFAVSLSAGVVAEGGHPAGVLDVPADTARSLAEHLLSAGFDPGVCRGVRLDHAFAQPLRELLGGITAVPVIPVAVNCATPPLPSAARALAVGDAVGAFLDRLPGRTLVIGSGGLSHSPPSMEAEAHDLGDEERARLIAEGLPAARLKIRPEWDRAVLAALADFDRDALVDLVDHATERAGAGGNEVRTWLAAAAAGGGALTTVAYEPVPDWITGMGVAASSR
jgi:2,3-dihydroxyphenylpropionate 1,2-dioxygenase